MKVMHRGKASAISTAFVLFTLHTTRSLISDFHISGKITKHFQLFVPHSYSCRLVYDTMLQTVHSVSTLYSYFIHLPSTSCTF